MAADVPIRPAATIMLVDDRPHLQVLMMQRTHKAVFAGNMWVFPGGRVDAKDHNWPLQPAHDKLLSELPDTREEALAFCIAAIRETFEEAGVLLARPENVNQVLDLTADQKSMLEGYREDLIAQKRSFAEIIEAHRLQPTIEEMCYLARWITPPGGPRRFDTRFFLSRMPKNQEPAHDNNETVRHEWLEPAKALELYQAGELVMMTPTLAMVSVLARFQNTTELFAALGEAGDMAQARVQPDNYQLVFPSEPAYDTASKTIEFGWLKLLPEAPVVATGAAILKSASQLKK